MWIKWILEESDRLQKNIDYYTQEYDLPNLLPENDGTPLGLKAILFSRYDYWVGYMGGSREEYAQQFKEWYLDKYIAKTKTHRQLLNKQTAGDAHS